MKLQFWPTLKACITNASQNPKEADKSDMTLTQNCNNISNNATGKVTELRLEKKIMEDLSSTLLG